MKKLFNFLNLLLCLELLVSPVAPGLSLLSTKALAETPPSCGTGFHYNSVTNSCQTNADTANLINATNTCAADDAECFRRNAENAFQSEVNEGNAPERKGNNGFVSTVANIGAVAGMTTLAISGLQTAVTKCQSVSMYLMIGGAAALVAGDMAANIGHANRLKKIRKSWGQIVNPEEAGGDADKEREASIEAQSKAFGKLAEAEDSLAKAAKLKKTLFMIATGAFTASGVVAALEVIADSTTGLATKAQNICVCASNAPTKRDFYFALNEPSLNLKVHRQQQYNLHQSKDLAAFLINRKAMETEDSSPLLTDYYSLKENLKGTTLAERGLFETFKEVTRTLVNNVSPISHALAQVTSNAAKAYKEDEAKGVNWGGLVGGVAVGVAASAFIKPKVISPEQRAIFSGVMAGLTLQMTLHAASQAKASENRADLLRKMQRDFLSATGDIYACKSEDRNDPGKPNCYCYTPDNTRNPNRSNSQICNNLWTGNTVPTAAYGGDGNVKVCIDSNNQADTACACQKTNTCRKVSVSGIKGLNVGTMSLLGQSAGYLNSIANGSFDAANVDEGSINNNAMKLSKLASELEKNKALKGFASTKKKKTDELLKQLSVASAGIPASGLLGSSGSSSMPTNPGEAARMLEKEIKNAEPTSVAGTNTIATPESNENLEFGLTADQLAAQEGQIAEVMKQNIDFNANDINQGSKTNIFEVLSNRYQRSGMRRLFDEKGTTTADKPAQNDITQ